jgi:hypothetical protein
MSQYAYFRFGVTLSFRKLRPKALIYPQEVIDELNKTLEQVASNVLEGYERATETWDEQPTFTVDKVVNENAAYIVVRHDSIEFTWVDFGTKSHSIGEGGVGYRWDYPKAKPSPIWFSKTRNVAALVEAAQNARLIGMHYRTYVARHTTKPRGIVRFTMPTWTNRQFKRHGMLSSRVGEYVPGLLIYPTTKSGGTLPAKTIPNWFGSRPSVDAGGVRSAYTVRHPGIKARNYTKNIKAKLTVWQKTRFYAAIRRGFYRARHK